MIPLTDIGVNLISPAFDRDRETVLADAHAAGVTKLIITGSSIASSGEAIAFAETHTSCRATAGVHPHNAKDWGPLPPPAALASLREMVIGAAAKGTFAAIGECGLDYNRNFSPPDAQRKCFEDQLALAAELGKPVFLHQRDAFDDFTRILKQYQPSLPGAVVHCFTGTAEELETYRALDCYIGITGWICDERRGNHLIPLLAQIPPERLLLETDAPYLLPRNLGPREKRSGRNEPRFLAHIAAFIAEILGKTPEQLAAETSANAARLFGLN